MITLNHRWNIYWLFWTNKSIWNNGPDGEFYYDVEQYMRRVTRVDMIRHSIFTIHDEMYERHDR